MGRRSILLYYKYGKIVRIQIKGHFMADINLKQLKDNLWQAADMLRAGAHLAANKYGQPILELKYAKFTRI